MKTTLHDFDGEQSLTFYTGELPVDATIRDAGHEPSGYFWDALVRFAWPDLADRLGLDSEAGMFAATGARSDLEELQAALEPVLGDPAAIRALLERATAAGYALDD